MSEVQTKYHVVEPGSFPASPAEIQITEETPTAQELEQYLEAWKQAAKESGKIRDLGMIAKTLGEDYPLEKTAYGSTAYRYVKRMESGAYTLYYYRLKSYQSPIINVEYYILKVIKNEGNQDEFIQVRIGYSIPRDREGKIVEERITDVIDDMVYIPGEWEDLFLLYKQQALYKIDERKKARQLRERDVLLKLIGVEI